KNADPSAPDRGFKRIIAAAAYHLAGYSAVAYSLFSEADNLNMAPSEIALRFLILRDLDALRSFISSRLTDTNHSDARLSLLLALREIEPDDAVVSIINTTICRAISYFDFALETGDRGAIAIARDLLARSISLADNSENVPLWWVARLARSLIDDLWA